MWSYWRKTHFLSAISGQPIRRAHVSARSAGAGSEAGSSPCCSASCPLGAGRRPVVERRLVGHGRHRDLGHRPPVPADPRDAVPRHLPDNARVQVPLLEDLQDLALPALLRDHEHPLLGLGEQELVGGHPLLALRHLVQVHRDAGPGPGGHLEGGGGQPRRPHVLDAHDGVRLHQLEAGLQEQLLGEGVAHLDRGALLLGLLVELRGGHRGAVDAVAARLATRRR